MKNVEYPFQHLVKIIVPIYKTDLDECETMSLNQLVTILKNHPKIIIKPKTLDISSIVNKYKDHFEVQDFEDDFFSNIIGYNRLMLTPEFYKTFIDSKYILIYQLDAFVFSDELDYWCQQNYDYIGAPWLCKSKYQKTFMKLFLNARGIIYAMFNVKHRQQCFYKVGNGGFSLRKTMSFYRIATEKQNIIEHYLKNVSRSTQFNEDVFWALEATKDKNFSVPSWRDALRFSFDLFPEICYQLSNNKLPFGCHRWNKELAFWNKYIPTRHANVK